MICENWQQQISLRQDGLLDAAQMAAVQSHLGGCPACREFATFLERLAVPALDCQPRPDIWAAIRPRLPAERPVPRVRRPLFPSPLVKAAGWLMITGLSIVFYTEMRTLQSNIGQLSEDNQALRRQVVKLEQDNRSDTALTKQAFAYYDCRNWQQACHCFNQLASYATREETRALALYYLSLMAGQDNDLDKAIALAERLVDNPYGSLYLPSLSLVLERWAESAITAGSAQARRRITALLEKICRSGHLTGHTAVSY